MVMIMILFLYQRHTIICSPVVILSARDNKNYQNFLVKDLKDQFIGMDIKQKVRIKIQQMNLDTFLNQILLELIEYLF